MTFLCPFIFFISALFKGGGPLRLRNGGGLAAPPGCVSIQDLMPHRRYWKRIPYPLMRVLSPLLHGTRLLLFVAEGHIWTNSCRADLASGLAGTLYEYTSILREPGGQAHEESAGQHRVLSLLGWSTRAMGSGFLVRSRCL